MQDKMYRFLPEATADEKVVKRLAEHLIRSYEEFLNTSKEPIHYNDAFMGAHNFYKALILDLEERTKAPIGKMAVATLELYLQKAKENNEHRNKV